MCSLGIFERIIKPLVKIQNTKSRPLEARPRTYWEIFNASLAGLRVYA